MRLAMPIKVVVHRFAFVLLVGAAFGLMLLGKADMVLIERARVAVVDAVAPVLAMVAEPVAAVEGGVSDVEALMNLRAENARLRAENARLLRWETAARNLKAENGSLRDLLNFRGARPLNFVSGRVISDGSGAFVRSLLVGIGSQDGLRKGLAAVSGHGLVGRVAEVGERSARILLITDLNSRIPVMLEGSRERAVLAGDNSDLPQLLYVGEEVRVQPGERIVTSGDGGAFPPGLPVGVVVAAPQPAAGDKAWRVQPFVDWSRLEYVRVMDYGLDGILTPDVDSVAVADRP